MSNDTVVVLFKGGRLPSWHGLTSAQRDDYERTHVDLMLSVALEHKMMRLEGYRLIGSQEHWGRFWVIEFPTLSGAEAWIDAEIEPPFGAHGQFEYHLARRWVPRHLAGLATGPPRRRRQPGVDPHEIPGLDVDRSKVVVLHFGRHLAPDDVAARTTADESHARVLARLAEEYGLARLEGFRLMTPQPGWQWVYVGELPSFDGAEAWAEAETGTDRQAGIAATVFLSRRWAPDYFDLWSPE